MARVTVEDCLDNVDNRFELVLVAAKRARQLARGQDAHVEWEQDKPTVVALREIAEGFVTNEILSEPEIEDQDLAGLQFVGIDDHEITAMTTQVLPEDDDDLPAAAASPAAGVDDET